VSVAQSSDRAIRHLGRRTRRQNPCTVLPERKGEHAIEVHFVESCRRDMTQYGCVDLALAARSPAVERGLHLMGVPCHDKIRDERERTGLGTQLFRTAPAAGPTARSADLTLERMGPLIVVEKRGPSSNWTENRVKP
jgi:hypothetical protein